MAYMRNMWLTSTCLIMILFMSGETSAQFEIAVTTLNTILTWGSTIIFTHLALTDGTGKNVKKLLDEVDEMSSQLSYFENQMDIKLDTMLSTLLNNIELKVQLQDLKTELLKHLHTIDYYHDQSLKYSLGGPYDMMKLERFIDDVLYGSNSLSKIIFKMHNIFNPGTHAQLNPGFLSIVVKETKLNLPTDCQGTISPNQSMYYVYVQLIIAEMKSVATIKKVYALKSWLEHYRFNYNTTLKELYNNFETEVREYHLLFAKQLARLPRHVRRCHVNTPKRGVDFLELEGLSRVKLFEPDFSEQLRCDCCVVPKTSYTENGIEMKAYDCKLLSRIVKACPARNGQRNDYSWWEDDRSTYGGAQSCSQPKIFNAGSETTAAMYSTLPYSRECNNWYCSAVEKIKQKDRSHSWRISSEPQISDIWNDMVVTGVKFIAIKKKIYLQIQQGKFSNNGMVGNEITWKNVETRYNVTGISSHYHVDPRIGGNKRTIFLDDIIVPQGSVVTGVQLRRIRRQSNFRLWVHATVFDFATGQLNPSGSFWCLRHKCGNKIPSGDYVRGRIEIDMGEADNPLRGSVFNYDPESNKMIKFTHTDAHKDAGQTTIPFIDLQPVQVQPAFPLSGVGLYYRGKKGFGGYIAPRIYTLDAAKLLKNSH